MSLNNRSQADIPEHSSLLISPFLVIRTIFFLFPPHPALLIQRLASWITYVRPPHRPGAVFSQPGFLSSLYIKENICLVATLHRTKVASMQALFLVRPYIST